MQDILEAFAVIYLQKKYFHEAAQAVRVWGVSHTSIMLEIALSSTTPIMSVYIESNTDSPWEEKDQKILGYKAKVQRQIFQWRIIVQWYRKCDSITEYNPSSSWRIHINYPK